MTNISFLESIFLISICIVSFIVPVVLLVLGYLMYNKLDRIEEMLRGKQ